MLDHRGPWDGERTLGDAWPLGQQRNTEQTQGGCHFTPIGMARVKPTCAEVEEPGPRPLLLGMAAVTAWKTFE